MTADQDILFHLGFQKTGTTTIQAMLNANADRFPDLDIRAYGDATKDLRVAGRNYCADPSAERRGKLELALNRHVDRTRENGKPCLISDENILGRVPYSSAGDVLTWAGMILPMIEASCSDLSIRFVFYTRQPDAWLHSSYNQAVKRGRVSVDFETWRNNAPFTVDWAAWRDRIQRLCEAPVEFVGMEDELDRHGFLGARLLHRMGVAPASWPDLVQPDVQNPSLPENALRLMRLVNRLPLPDSQVIRISETVENLFAKGTGK